LQKQKELEQLHELERQQEALKLQQQNQQN
jgi:hypothetical protein